MFDTVDQLLPAGGGGRRQPLTLAVAWTLAHTAITAPIVGASRPDQLESSLEAAEFVLEDDLKRRLDELASEYRMGDAQEQGRFSVLTGHDRIVRLTQQSNDLPDIRDQVTDLEYAHSLAGATDRMSVMCAASGQQVFEG